MNDTNNPEKTDSSLREAVVQRISGLFESRDQIGAFDLADAAIAVVVDRCAQVADKYHKEDLIGNGRNPADYIGLGSIIRDRIRALAREGKSDE